MKQSAHSIIGSARKARTDNPANQIHRRQQDRAWRLDRQADNELLLGHTDLAERLAHEAAALREVASP